MLRRGCSSLFAVLSLAILAACSGCTTCQSCDDYCGSYYGGRTGDWVYETGRAGSVDSHTAAASSGVAVEVVQPMPADSYYP